MTFVEQLESLQKTGDAQKYADFLNGIRSAAQGTPFADLVLYALDTTEKNLVALLKRCVGSEDNVHNLCGRLQAIEVLRQSIFTPTVVQTPEESN